jgi:hypothetical protein
LFTFTRVNKDLLVLVQEGMVTKWIVNYEGMKGTYLGGGQKVHGGGVSVVAVLEVAVERGQDSVFLLVVQVIARPLLFPTKTRTQQN